MPLRLRACLFWLHLSCGVVIGLPVLVTAATGATMSFQAELTAWREQDVRAAVAPRLPPLELVRRVDAVLPPHTRPDTLLFSRAPGLPAVVENESGSWLVDASDGRLLAASGVRRFFRAVEDVHRSVGLVLVGVRRAGSTLAGCVAIGLVLLALSGPWLWWPQKVTRAQLRRRLWPAKSATTAARDFGWHHAVGIWCMPVLLLAGLSGVLLCFDDVSDWVGARLGQAAEIDLALDADAAVVQAVALAPDWSALRIGWSPEGRTRLRVRLGRGVRPTEWAELGSSEPDSAGLRHTFLRCYRDGRPGDQLLGWVRWLHTGQALGRVGQAVWCLGLVGVFALVWTGLSLALRRLLRAVY